MSDYLIAHGGVQYELRASLIGAEQIVGRLRRRRRSADPTAPFDEAVAYVALLSRRARRLLHDDADGFLRNAVLTAGVSFIQNMGSHYLRVAVERFENAVSRTPAFYGVTKRRKRSEQTSLLC